MSRPVYRLGRGGRTLMVVISVACFVGSGCSSKDEEPAQGRAPVATEGIAHTVAASGPVRTEDGAGPAVNPSHVPGASPSTQFSDAEQQMLDQVFANLRSLPRAEDKLRWLRLVLDMCQRENLRLPIVSGALGNGDLAVRCGTVRLLTRYDVDALVPAYEIGLKDPCEEVRLAVVSALRSQPGPNAASLLSRAARDDSAAVRKAATAALRERKTESSPVAGGTNRGVWLHGGAVGWRGEENPSGAIAVT